MRKKLKLLFSIFFIVCKIIFSQSITISGYVEDAKSGERLISANIYEKNLQIGSATNNYGFFSLVLPQNQNYGLTISYIGYETSQLNLSIKKDTLLQILLSPKSFQTEEILVESDANDEITKNTQMSNINIPIRQIVAIPALLGETDILKALQLLPGVQSGNEGSSGLYVRGGSPEQNLILLDGTTVYNASHLFGFFSVFNSDAVKNVNLLKGGFPARFGGRLSSILEINMKEGNNKEYEGCASIGLISSRVTYEGPVYKDITSFILSARRTYIDILAKPFMDDKDYGGYYFYDLNAKLNHIFSLNDRLFFSLYLGNDEFYAVSKADWDYSNSRNDFSLGWGNITSVLRWNHIFSNNLFSNVTANFSRFRFYTEVENSSEYQNIKEIYKAEYLSGITDFGLAIDFEWIPNQNNNIKFGANLLHHKFNPGVFQYSITQNIDTSISASSLHNAIELRTYFEDDFEINSNLKINAGIHSSLFSVSNKNYFSFEPRISLRYLISDWSIKTSYTFMNQYVHLLTNSGIGLPTDLWVPTTDIVQPEKAHQAALGISKNIFDNEFEFTIETYYKKMSNLLEYKEGAEFFGLNSDWQNKITFGEGNTYGVEFFLQKKKRNTTGWLGYTLAWSKRKFNELNNGKEYPYKYDRRHDISLVLSHKISDGFDASLNWVYGTGNAISLPYVQYYGNTSLFDQYYNYNFQQLEYFGEKNSYRMPAYHRLDFACRFFWGEENSSVLTFAVYNVYSQKNPFFYYFDNDYISNKKVLKQVTLFPIIPSISYSFKF